MKKCNKCGETKELIHFYKNKYGKDGRQAWCKKCHRIRWGNYTNEEGIAERRYDVEAQRKFGLRPGELINLRAAQGNKCLCCNNPGKLEVDHDHAVGRVRGLLCGSCNKALGLIRDNPDTALKLYAYLKGLI